MAFQNLDKINYKQNLKTPFIIIIIMYNHWAIEEGA